MRCILDQRRVKNIRYGLFTSDYNGCSWVAVYNALCLVGDEREPETVARYFEKYLPLGGAFGMPFSRFLCALNGFGVKYKRVSTNSSEAKNAKACILWYMKKNLKSHFCAVQYVDEIGAFRYINPTAKAQPLEIFLSSVGAVSSKLILIDK